MLLFLLWGCVDISTADARDYWEWTDRVSCRPRKRELDQAWDEFRALAIESYEALSGTLSQKTRVMMNSMYNPDISDIDVIRGKLCTVPGTRNLLGRIKGVSQELFNRET